MCTWSIRLLCLLALLACMLSARTQAGQPVYRCIGAHGEPVFSGQPCGTPAPASGTSTTVQANGVSAECAASPEALRRAIAGTFATHDVNQLAGLILWRGMDEASARVTLRSLATWLKQPLTGIAVTGAAGPPHPDTDAGPIAALSSDAPASASSAARPAPTGFDVSTGGVAGTTRDFGITESGGCWWLTF